VSCETAVFIANSVVEKIVFSSQPRSMPETGSALASSSIASITWAKHQFPAETRRLFTKQPLLDRETLILDREMSLFKNELCHMLCHEDSLYHDRVWQNANHAIMQEILRDQANFLLAIQAPRGSSQRESLMQSLRFQIQRFILLSASNISVLGTNDESAALRSLMQELAVPRRNNSDPRDKNSVSQSLFSPFQFLIDDYAGNCYVSCT
jgi:hypothetical protein